jgi:uncharacterized protein YjbK
MRNESNQELEQEAKGLLTEQQYVLLLSHFTLERDSAKKQKNSYFDTLDWKLDSRNMMLRVREKKGEFELTLKEEAVGGDRIETNHRPLTHEQGIELRQSGVLPESKIQERMEELNILPPFMYQGDLITHRIEIPYRGCKLALDSNLYLDQRDFEIEMEKEEANADEKKALAILLQELNIPYVLALSKAKRFFNARRAEMTFGQ